MEYVKKSHKDTFFLQLPDTLQSKILMYLDVDTTSIMTKKKMMFSCCLFEDWMATYTYRVIVAQLRYLRDEFSYLKCHGRTSFDVPIVDFNTFALRRNRHKKELNCFHK